MSGKLNMSGIGLKASGLGQGLINMVKINQPEPTKKNN